MCEFCHKHGEGKKWYLQAKNYSEDLLSDLRRRNFIKNFLGQPIAFDRNVKRVGVLSKIPGFVKNVMGKVVVDKMKKLHYGQVVPIEEVERIFDFVTSVVRFACLCRHITKGSEYRYCYGLSMAPNGGQFAEILREIDASYLNGPDAVGIETVSKDEALSAMRMFEQDGLCHTVWAYVTPFIGGICNCDQQDCLAMRVSVTYDVPAIFRAEYVSRVNPDLCNGCKECLRLCQFGAISYSIAQEKATIDPKRCYGCGICRSACSNNAILLDDRIAVISARDIW